MPRKPLLTFYESDGHAHVEILGSHGDFADLVDPNDGSVLHTEPFTMDGREWRIETVTVTEHLICIDCVSTAGHVQLNPLESSSRSSIRR